MPAIDVLDSTLDWGKSGAVLSTNQKCGRSLNFPIEKGHCRPSLLCEVACYAKTGRLSMDNSLTHQDKVARYFEKGDMSKLIAEVKKWKYPSIRVSASGDLKPAYVKNLVKVAKACPDSMFWGMTKRSEIAVAVNGYRLPNLALLISLDSSTHLRKTGRQLEALLREDADQRYCFTEISFQTVKRTIRAVADEVVDQPDLTQDDINDMLEFHAYSDYKNDPQLVVVFPEHKGGKVLVDLKHDLDCPAVRGLVDGCWQCGRCWNSFPWVEGRKFMNGEPEDIDPSLPMPKNW